MKNVFEILETKIDIPFNEQINSLREKSMLVKSKFLTEDLLTTKKEDFEFFCLRLITYYRQLCFFPDKDIEDRFKTLGLSKIYLHWMIPIQEICDEFYKIENDMRVVILKPVTLECIKTHLHTKIFHEIMCWADFSAEKVESNKLHATVISFYKKRGYRLKNNKKPKEGNEKELDDLLETLKRELGSEKAAKIAYLKKTQGKTEYFFLKFMLENTFMIHKDLNQTRFYSKVYDLFRLICKDETLPDKEKFLEIKDIARSNWQKFQAQTIKKLIYKK